MQARRSLGAALRARYPWVADTAWGPAAVEAGECDGCGAEARLVQTCGPGTGQYLGRACAGHAGVEAWCAGHAEEARAALAWLAVLPAEADVVARLWWVSTGEVTLSPDLVATQVARLALRP